MQQSLVVFALLESEYVVKNLKLLKAKQFIKHAVDFFFIDSTMMWLVTEMWTERHATQLLNVLILVMKHFTGVFNVYV